MQPENGDTQERRRLDRERWRLLFRLERWLETPMVLLGFVWLVLRVVELTRGLDSRLERVSATISAVFVFDFLLRLVLAPRRLAYLRRNWLTVVALFLPALRVVRVVDSPELSVEALREPVPFDLGGDGVTAANAGATAGGGA